MMIKTRLATSDTWLLEVFLALYTIAWGLSYTNPLVDTFASNPSAYAVLARLPGGEVTLGLVLVLLGSTTLGAALWGARAMRSLSTGVAGGAWLSTAIAIGVPTHWAAGGIPGFALVALAHWFCWTRLRYRGPA